MPYELETPAIAVRNRLGLRARLFLTLLVAAATLGWGTWEIMSQIILSRFAKLETYHANENASRAKNLILERANHLAVHASDWGAWDETYNYVEDLNPEYVKANLTSDGISRLNISSLVYLDADGVLKASIGFDFASQQVVDATEAIKTHEWSCYSLYSAELNTKHAGVVFVDGAPWLMGASQILTSEGIGPVRGTIVELRKIDQRELDSLSKSLRFPFSLSSSQTSTSEPIQTELLDANTLEVRFQLNELFGTKNVDGVCRLDRLIMVEGNNALADSRLVFLLTGGCLSVLMYLVLGRLVIARICHMTEEINSLDFKSTELRVGDSGRDEIGELAKQFNSLFDSILAARKQLCSRNSELAEAKVRAESANRSKSAFLANMSHEIRTPLTAILGYTDILREDKSEALTPAKQIETIDTIQRAGKHLLTVINDILDLSKIEADKMTLERIPTSVSAILLEIKTLMLSRAKEKNIQLNLKCVSPIPNMIDSDPTRLRQILMNLVGNAIKFTNSGSVTIQCGLECTNGRSILFFDIEDTGLGLSKAQADELFQAFTQADETVTRSHGGTGLGLTICRRLANLMDGDVRLLRSEPAVGSCFRLELPIVVSDDCLLVNSLEVATTSESVSTPASLRLEGRVLLAEDGLDNQKLIRFHLKKAGAVVEVADNGQIALEMIEHSILSNTPYDLLVTDMQMPVMDGYTLASTLRERRVSIPIVALTAHAMAEDRVKCLEAGCDDYATKPIDKVTLVATCEKWIRKGSVADASSSNPVVTFAQIEPRAQTALTVFSRETVTRLVAPAAQ